MGIDYDAWLEKPYQDQYEAEEAWERAEERFLAGDYAQYLDEWLEDNPGKTEDDYKESPSYERAVESCIEDERDAYADAMLDRMERDREDYYR